MLKENIVESTELMRIPVQQICPHETIIQAAFTQQTEQKFFPEYIMYLCTL